MRTKRSPCDILRLERHRSSSQLCLDWMRQWCFFSWKKSLYVLILGPEFVFSFVGNGVCFDCDETLPDKVWWNVLAAQHWSSKSHLQLSPLKRNLEPSCCETQLKKVCPGKRRKAGISKTDEVLSFPFKSENPQHICNRVQPREGPQVGICNGVQKSLEIIGSTPQGHTCLECWQLWPNVGGARNGSAEEDWRWDLNPGGQLLGISFWDHASFRGPRALGVFWGTTRRWASFRGPYGFGRVRITRLWKCSLLPRGWCWGSESWTSTSFLR